MNSIFSKAQVETAEQHSIPKSVFLHFLPGILMLAAYLLGSPLVMKAGYPSVFALVIAEVVILLPYGFGHLFYLGKKRNGRWSLSGIILYQTPMPKWQYFVLVPLGVLCAILFFTIFSPLDVYLRRTVFSWLPSWYFSPSFSGYSRSALITLCSVAVVADGVGGPLIEELYFRGYLLPRISRLGVGAPVLNALLFAMYHFWQPMNFPSLLGASLVLAFSTWWKGNVRISLLIHCFMNTMGQVMGLLSVLSGS